MSNRFSLTVKFGRKIEDDRYFGRSRFVFKRDGFTEHRRPEDQLYFGRLGLIFDETGRWHKLTLFVPYLTITMILSKVSDSIVPKKPFSSEVLRSKFVLFPNKNGDYVHFAFRERGPIHTVGPYSWRNWRIGRDTIFGSYSFDIRSDLKIHTFISMPEGRYPGILTRDTSRLVFKTWRGRFVDRFLKFDRTTKWCIAMKIPIPMYRLDAEGIIIGVEFIEEFEEIFDFDTLDLADQVVGDATSRSIKEREFSGGPTFPPPQSEEAVMAWVRNL
jgi:hypothetical protein